MSTPAPDWAALYEKHRNAMYGVAHNVLRNSGNTSEVADVVHDAMLSLMANPPKNVTNWEAMLVATTRRRALDRLRSANSRHAAGGLAEDFDPPDEGDAIEEASDAMDRRRDGALVWDALAVLDERHRHVVREFFMNQRPRGEVADELGVTPARVSQILKSALNQLSNELKK